MQTKEIKKNKKGFFDYFPAPSFLKMSSVGLALSDDAIHIIELLGNPGRYRLGHHSEVALQKGVIQGGYIYDIQALGRVLRELKNRKNLSFVRASLPEEKGYVFIIRIPHLQYEEMRSSIEFKIEENAPVKLSEVIFDFNIIPGSLDANNTVEVSVSVLPTKVVEAYVDALGSADIVPVAFEVESQAIARAIKEKEETDVFAILNLSPKKSGIYIVKKGIVVFTSTVTFSEGSEKTPEVFLSEELQRVILFWTTRDEEGMKQSGHISMVKVVGNNPDFEKIYSYLSNELTIPIKVANVWVNTFSLDAHIPEIKKEDSVRFASAIGLALPVDKE